MGSETLHKQKQMIKTLVILLAYLPVSVISETGDCREQEYRDQTGICSPCKQCGPGKELSKECGFGYGEDAQCVTCRPNRFKEDWGFQKCKPCLDCALVNRFQKANCTTSNNAVCGDCLPGFYRKTKLGGFQDMECIPCGDPPPPYEPHCTAKVDLVKIPSTASSPRDTALAAVICSALATVLLALLILCVIYCKRQFMEKKPSWSTRSQESQYNGAELSCFDRPRINDCTHRTCCQCQRDPAQTCGPVHLIPSLCCDETCSLEHSNDNYPIHSQTTLHERDSESMGELVPPYLGSFSHAACGDPAETWPLMQNSTCSENSSIYDSHPDFLSEDTDHVNKENETFVTQDLDIHEGPCCRTISHQSCSQDLEETCEMSEESRCMATVLDHNSPTLREQKIQRPQNENEASVNHDGKAE